MTPGELAKQREWMQQLRQSKIGAFSSTLTTPPTSSEKQQPQNQNKKRNNRDLTFGNNTKGRLLRLSKKQQKTTGNQQEATTKKDEEKKKDKQMPILYFFLWLFLGVLTDLLSLIPYVGIIFSWPFALCFGVYKFMSGLNWRKTMIFSAMDIIAETIFSTVPACTLDVILTFVASRQKKITMPGGIKTP